MIFMKAINYNHKHYQIMKQYYLNFISNFLPKTFFYLNEKLMHLLNLKQINYLELPSSANLKLK